MTEKSYYVYLLASARNGTFYLGVTSDLVKRAYGSTNDLADGFTKRYGIKTLVWYEQHIDIMEAIKREKQIKKWARVWKLELIESTNPEWQGLYPGIIG